MQIGFIAANDPAVSSYSEVSMSVFSMTF